MGENFCLYSVNIFEKDLWRCSLPRGNLSALETVKGNNYINKKINNSLLSDAENGVSVVNIYSCSDYLDKAV